MTYFQLKIDPKKTPLKVDRKAVFILQKYLIGSKCAKGQNCCLQNYIQNIQGNICTSYLMNFNKLINQYFIFVQKFP